MLQMVVWFIVLTDSSRSPSYQVYIDNLSPSCLISDASIVAHYINPPVFGFCTLKGICENKKRDKNMYTLSCYS